MTLKDQEAMLRNCTRCSNCKWSPVVKSDEFAAICPSIQYGKFHSFSGGGKLISAAALLEGRVTYDADYVETIYACSMCGACDTACKTQFGEVIEPLTSLYAIRRDIWEKGAAPEALRSAVNRLSETGSVTGISATVRKDWCATMMVPSSKATILLHVGDLAFDEQQWPALRYVVAEMTESRVQFMLGAESEPDTGALAFEAGAVDIALKFANRFATWVRSLGVQTIVTCSDRDFAALRSYYPRLGVSLGGVTVMHASEWLAEQAASSNAAGVPEVVTYHDGCRLGRLSESYQPWSGQWEIALNALPVRKDGTQTGFGVDGVYDAPRQLLSRVGAQIVEMERTREFAFCAGAGAGAELDYPEFASVAGVARLEEALATGATTLVSGCESCTTHLQAVAIENAMSIRVVNLLDFIRVRDEIACIASPGLSTSA